MPSPKQSVIGYGRVSTEEQENNYSLDAQRARFEHLCKQNHWRSLGFFPETGSGTSVINRPVLSNLLRRVEQGGIDALWVKETDRLSRPENLGDLSLISQTLEAARTLLIVDSRTLDLSEDNSVLTLDFEGVLAKHFRRQLLRNMKRGQVRKAELGRKAAGSDVFGYTTNDKGEYSPHPDEAPIVRLIYELFVKGFSTRELVKELRRRRIRTKRGREVWSIAVVGGILRNEMYIGVYRYQKTKQPKDEEGIPYRVQHSKTIVVGSSEKPNHPPIIDRWLFDLVQQKLVSNRKKTTVHPHMATGILRCPVCSAYMNAKTSTASHKTKRREVKYTCSKKPNCNSRRMLVSDTNDLLWAAMVELFVAPDRIQSLISPATETDLDSLKKQLAAIEKEQKVASQKTERLLNLYLEGNLPQAVYVMKSSELESETERLAQSKTELQQQIQSHGKQDRSAALIQTIRLLSRSHRRFNDDQKVKVFRSVIKEARLTPTGVEFEMYVQPTQNVYWKYRQKSPHRKKRLSPGQTVRVGIPRSVPAPACVYTSREVADILGISIDLLRLRIRRGKYPDTSLRDGLRRQFTNEQVQRIRAIG